MEVLGLHIHVVSFSNNFHRHQIVIPAVIRKLRITENTMPTATKTWKRTTRTLATTVGPKRKFNYISTIFFQLQDDN